jgi:hypothetical protein
VVACDVVVPRVLHNPNARVPRVICGYRVRVRRTAPNFTGLRGTSLPAIRSTEQNIMPFVAFTSAIPSGHTVRPSTKNFSSAAVVVLRWAPSCALSTRTCNGALPCTHCCSTPKTSAPCTTARVQQH